ncbi:M56 family metallopeptidase [Paenibacillus sp. P96]|uniref:M56 family metallopeptidase n=1 Tax=Paenibacillus zeirhizosphaerae TaxID=2987519 RepID=A0ABT9FR28_9BACL|nr:M56 family metallopeptidase [Paenibacillus sp. P96]MDP4097188.1 M56 family metallopeptidase [Paenibacillus sp. P96]
MNIIEMSLSASMLIVAVMVIRWLALHLFPKSFFLMLWGIALCRLLFPWSIPVPSWLGIHSLSDTWIGRITGGSQSIEAAKHTYEPGSVAAVLAVTPDRIAAVSVQEVLTVIWIAGMAGFILWFGIAFYRSYRQLSMALPYNNSFVERWLQEQKLRRPLQIVVSDRITTPLAYGIFKPKIILPKSLAVKDEQELSFILMHELTHIRRLDTLWKMVLLAALCVHWFNPLAWLLYKLMSRDIELACDEKVIRIFGEQAKPNYAMSLIAMAEQKAKFSPLYNGYSKNLTEERITSIMKFKKASVLTMSVALLLVVGAASVFADSSAADKAQMLKGPAVEGSVTNSAQTEELNLPEAAIPGPSDMAVEKAVRTATEQVAKQYGVSSQTLSQFTVTPYFWSYEKTGETVWRIEFNPTEPEDYASIGCYYIEMDSKTGEVVKTISAGDAVG